MSKHALATRRSRSGLVVAVTLAATYAAVMTFGYQMPDPGQSRAASMWETFWLMTALLGVVAFLLVGMPLIARWVERGRD